MRERDRESVQAFTHGATTPTATSTVSQGRITRTATGHAPRIAKNASQRQLVRVEYHPISRR